jgi:hypothetical protein
MILQARTLIMAACGLSLIFAAPIPVIAQDNGGWVGKRVAERQMNLTLKLGDKVVDRAHRIEVYRVERMEGPWV